MDQLKNFAMFLACVAIVWGPVFLLINFLFPKRKRHD